MKVFPAHPGVKPIIDMYCDSFTKLSMPWKTPRPVAEVRLEKNQKSWQWFLLSPLDGAQ